MIIGRPKPSKTVVDRPEASTKPSSPPAPVQLLVSLQSVERHADDVDVGALREIALQRLPRPWGPDVLGACGADMRHS